MTPDLGLVADAAQRDTAQLTVQGTGHRHGDGGLAYAGRADKANHLPLQVGSELAHGQELQYPLFHLLQTKVVVVQHLPGALHADLLLGLLAPGQFQANIQVVAHDSGFGGAVGLLGQAAYFLLQPLPHIVGQLGLSDFLAVVAQLRVRAPLPFAQLGLNGLELLPKVVVPLVIRHLLPCPVLDLHVQTQDLHLTAQQAVQPLQTAHRAQLL